jgi:hypothetical protein
MDRSGAAKLAGGETSRPQNDSQLTMPLPQGGSSMTSSGRDEFVVAESLVTALMALEELPEVRRPGS